MLNEQDSSCRICGRLLQAYHIDYCHFTGKVRGLLCHRCNILIGGWDDPAWRAKAARYLGL
jgi:hypothetical protein